MYRILWREDAIISLNDIGFYIAEHNPRAAQKLISHIQDIVNNQLSFMPMICPKVESASLEELRLCSFATPYLILYRISEDKKHIEIIDIYHGARGGRP